jgi:DNA mismatch repair protein MutS
LKEPIHQNAMNGSKPLIGVFAGPDDDRALPTGQLGVSLREQREPHERTIAFRSILFQPSEDVSQSVVHEEPSFFRDLNLDQIVERITSDWNDYDLTPFYYTRLKALDAIVYRQEVMRDLQDHALLKSVQTFSSGMRSMRQRLEQSKKSYYNRAAERIFLDAVQTYCDAIQTLANIVSGLDLRSRGLQSFREFVTGYVASEGFRSLAREAGKLITDLTRVRYGLQIKDDTVTVRPFGDEINYSEAVEETFAKFRTNQAGNHWVEPRKVEGMNHIQAQILDRVALLYPELFGALQRFSETHADFLDLTVARFDREIQFYVAYLVYIEKFRRAGLGFCEPLVSATSKAIDCQNTFDLALADKLITQKSEVVTNSFYLGGQERLFVVSGPNQGGKTTFARTFGQLHYLASLGCPVPGTQAQLFLFDQLFTHFERVEDITNFRGKLQDDLVRIHAILGAATPDSLVVMNEIFASTTLKDAVYLSKKIMAKLSDLDLLGVCVTFLDELASFDQKAVSMVATVDPENLATRTFKLERKPADGLAYALAIAQKYRVTYEGIKERIVP